MLPQNAPKLRVKKKTIVSLSIYGGLSQWTENFLTSGGSVHMVHNLSLKTLLALYHLYAIAEFNSYVQLFFISYVQKKQVQVI